MPITLKYGAPGPILEAGYASGVAHRQHEQQDDTLKLWQQQQQQAFQAQQAALGRLQTAGLQAASFGQQARQADLNRQQRAKQQATAFEQQTNLQTNAFEQQAKQDQERRDFAWESDAARSFEGDISDRAAEMAKKSRFLTPEGRKLWGDLSGEYRAIQAQRGELRPQQYSKLLSEWQSKYNSSGVEKHINEPPPVSDQWKSAAVEVAPGYFMAQQPDGKWMEVDTRAKGAPMKPSSQQPLHEYLADDATYNREFKESHKRLDDIAEAEYKAATEAAAMKGNSGPPAKREITHEEIQAEMEKSIAARQDHLAKLRSAAGMSGEQPGSEPDEPKPTRRIGPQPVQKTDTMSQDSGQTGSQQPWTADRIAQRFAKSNPSYQQNIDPEVLKRITPDAVQEAERLGATDPVASAAFLASLHVDREREDVNTAGRIEQARRDEKSNLMANGLARTSDIPQADQTLLAKLPHPKTMQEVMDDSIVPPGSSFIDPKGIFRVKPKR